MKWLLGLFRPPPPEEEIQDKSLVKSKYKYWRWRTFYGMYVGYVFYYFSRKSLFFAMPEMIKDLGYTKVDLGILVTILSFAYGASKFLSGVLSDRANPRLFMGLGLITTGVLNIFFGMCSSLVFFALFWGLNGYFQGYGWPPCSRLLTHWYSHKERGTWWGFWNTSHSVGAALIALLGGFIAENVGWRFAFYVPGVLCIISGIFVINRLRDTPRSLGLPSIENFKSDHPPNEKPDQEKRTVTDILFNDVLKNKFIWILALSYFFIYVIRTGIDGWSYLFLKEHKGYDSIAAAACVFWFEIGGIFGSLAAGWLSDKMFKGKRGPINVLFSLGAIFAIFAFWASPAGVPMLDSLIMFATGFLIFGPQMLIGMVAAELAGKKAAGSATGFVGLVANLGAASAGVPLGFVCETFGWKGFFIAVAACGVLAVSLLFPLWRVGGSKSADEIDVNIADDDDDAVEAEPTS